MISCFYKKSFLKDLAKLPKRYRQHIERLVFEEIPKLDNVFATLDVRKIQGHKSYYRIRVGNYRIGCKVERKNQIVFYRVRSRADIYKLFPE